MGFHYIINFDILTGVARESFCVVFITASNAKEADRISLALVKGRLAACVNAVPAVKSRYWWKGKIETARESLLIAKTRRSLVGKLTKKVKAIHSYSVPEVIALPIVK